MTPRAWATVRLDAVTANARALVSRAAPAALCAVVKANGYGHGANQVARAAVDGGAAWLAVAQVEEGAALRRTEEDVPVLVLSEPPATDFGEVVAGRLTPTLYTEEGVAAAAKAAADAGVRLDVHAKVDTGMHRVGASPEDALRIVEAIDGRAELRLAGVWTHLAVADEAGNEFTAVQLARFRAVVDEIRGRGIDPGILHAANSAGTLWHPASHLDLVRCGIALYGLAPGPSVTAEALTPALRFEARVTFVKRVAAGEGISYGLRYRPGRPTTIATVPVGYADGVPRALSERGEVLIGGRRRRIAGTITMDQLMVDCGDADVQIGDEVVLLGRQGEAEVSADEWAALTGTINYEIVSRIGPRVVRRYE